MNTEFTDYEALDITSDSQYFSKPNVLLREFIECYKASPELWRPTHVRYSDKRARDVALDKLAAILRKRKRDANRIDVRKKINTLRSNYRKEFRKVKLKMELNDSYTPRNWVFYAMKFIDSECPENRDTPENRTEGCDSDDEAMPKDCIEIVESVKVEESTESRENEENTSSGKTVNQVVKILQKPSLCESGGANAATPQFLISPIPIANLLQNKGNRNIFTTTSSTNRLKIVNNASAENTIVATLWEAKLQNLAPDQKIFAEKAINDVLFEASLGNLHRHSVKINEDPLYH